jgi:hypothetical protein
MVECRSAPARFNLIGQGFGCRVLCSALQALAQDPALLARLAGSEFNVALLQPATDPQVFAPGQLYSPVQSVPKLRMLIATGDRDTAMGAPGPTGGPAIPVDQLSERLSVANLTTLHNSDINCFPVHDLLAHFFGQ